MFMILVLFASDLTPTNSFLRVTNFFILLPNMRDKVQGNMWSSLVAILGLERPTETLNLKF